MPADGEWGGGEAGDDGGDGPRGPDGDADDRNGGGSDPDPVTFADRESLAATPAHDLALACLEAGIDATGPGRAVARYCSLDGDRLGVDGSSYDLSAYDEVLVLGGGKAADGLAAALAALLGDRLAGGVVVTDARTADPGPVDVHEGSHPVPDGTSVAGAEAVLERAASAGERTLVLATITGGGSSLLCAPAPGLDVAAIRTVTAALLEAGAPVDEVNEVRRACSGIKGGGLAAAADPATVVSLLVSDVVGDDPAVVASGPTVPAPIDPSAALAVLERYDVTAPAVRTWLADRDASPAPDVALDAHVLASGRDAVAAARSVAADRGFEPCVLSTGLEGEAREVGRVHAAIAAAAVESGDPVAPPAVLLSGGETTVTVSGDGVGGPNLECALGAALALPDGAVLGAVDTDGRDGSTDAAGAIVDAETVAGAEPRAAARAALAANDTYAFLASRDALLTTGPTGTNVDDLRVVVVPRQ